MPALYELAASYKNIAELLDDPLIPQEAITSAMAIVEGDIAVKSQNIAVILNSMDSDITILEAEIKRLTNRKTAIDKGKKWLKGYLQEQLEKIGQKQLKTPMFTISIQNNPPALQITDEKAIPASYLTIVPERKEPNKEDIKAALKAGKEVPGAILTRGKSLRVR